MNQDHEASTKSLSAVRPSGKQRHARTGTEVGVAISPKGRVSETSTQKTSFGPGSGKPEKENLVGNSSSRKEINLIERKLTRLPSGCARKRSGIRQQNVIICSGYFLIPQV
jgi:hypothetical protein